LDEKFSTLNVDIVAYLCNIVSPVFGNNIDGNKSETATSKYEVKQDTSCTQTQTDSVNLNMTHNSTYNDENLVFSLP
jgi:hypothetical protein